jgi:hypothetical protein
MRVLEVKSGKKTKAIVLPVKPSEYRFITKRSYFFDWKSAKEECLVFKLMIEGQTGIAGLMALKAYPEEMRYEIKLICVSRENKGRHKKYDWIAGCLIAYACREARLHYTIAACVSLIPKTGIKNHYMEKYGMLNAGWQLFLEGKSLDQMILNYLYESKI